MKTLAICALIVVVGVANTFVSIKVSEQNTLGLAKAIGFSTGLNMKHTAKMCRSPNI